MRTVIKTILGLVLVLGLLVGFGHWQLAKQTPDGLWEYDLEGVEGSIHVAGDTVLIDDTLGGDGWVAIDLEDGKRLAGESFTTVYAAQLGANGWFAIASGTDFRHQTVRVYDDRGQQVWQRKQDVGQRTRVFALSDDGVVVATYDPIGNGDAKHHRLQQVGPDGQVVWERSMEKGESAFNMTWGFRDQDEDHGDWTSVPRVPAVTIDKKVVRLLDEDGRPTGPAANRDSSIVVGDKLVSASLNGDTCEFRADNVDGEVWRSSIPCDGAPFLPEAIGELMLVSQEGSEGHIAVDLDTGEAAPVEYGGPRGFNPEKLTAVAVSDEVVVEQHKSTFTARDPFTGEKTWTFEGPGPTKGLTSNKRDRYPGVDVSRDKVSILSATTPWWRLFAWGATVPKSTVTILGARNGEEIATYRSADLYSMTAAPNGSILLISDGVLRLIER